MGARGIYARKKKKRLAHKKTPQQIAENLARVAATERELGRRR